MNLGEKTNRGLRHLVLETYLSTEPDLVKLNISKLQILNSISGEVIHLPDISGIPHDAAVQVPQPSTSQSIIPHQQQLIWFDFLALLPDPKGQATSSGTQTLDTERSLAPPFYIILFPKVDEYVAIVPQHVAWMDKDFLSTDVSIPGPWLPYIMKVQQVEKALRRIGMVAWGTKYVNPGTEVVLGKWCPSIVTERVFVPASEQSWSSPLVQTYSPLLVHKPSPNMAEMGSRIGKKHRREDILETSATSILPPVTRRKTSHQQDVKSDYPATAPTTTLSLHPYEQFLNSVEAQQLSAVKAVDEVLESQLWPGYIPRGMNQQVANATSLGPNERQYISTGLKAEGSVDSTCSQRPWLDALWTRLDASSQPGCLPSPQPATQLIPSFERISEPVESLHQSTISCKGLSQHESTPQLSANPPAPFPSVNLPHPLPGPSTPIESFIRPPEANAPAVRLLELHPRHPFANHLYIPSSTQTSPLLHLLKPSTPCLPILTTYTHLPSGSPTPLSRLQTTHPCLHILLSPSSPSTLHFLPSRILQSYTSHLQNLLQGTLNASRRKSAKPDFKRSCLRGKNKRRTERPEIGDVLEWAAGGRKVDVKELGMRLEEEFGRERARVEGDRSVCTVREVLQAQVDGLWDVRE